MEIRKEDKQWVIRKMDLQTAHTLLVAGRSVPGFSWRMEYEGGGQFSLRPLIKSKHDEKDVAWLFDTLREVFVHGPWSKLIYWGRFREFMLRKGEKKNGRKYAPCDSLSHLLWTLADRPIPLPRMSPCPREDEWSSARMVEDLQRFGAKYVDEVKKAICHRPNGLRTDRNFTEFHRLPTELKQRILQKFVAEPALYENPNETDSLRAKINRLLSCRALSWQMFHLVEAEMQRLGVQPKQMIRTKDGQLTHLLSVNAGPENHKIPNLIKTDAVYSAFLLPPE